MKPPTTTSSKSPLPKHYSSSYRGGQDHNVRKGKTLLESQNSLGWKGPSKSNPTVTSRNIFH